MREADLTFAEPQTLQGLTEEEAVARRERGEGNDVTIDTSRSYMDILRQNFFTFINIILFIIGFIMILLDLWGDAFVSVGVVMMNVVVGVVQEFRAKAKLDRIALLTRPKATIIRDGQQREVDPAEIVLGDIIVAHAGDQIVVDGVVVGEGRMDVDESLLTGESDLVPKAVGDEVFSGSFCVTGSAAYEATRVGADSFANKLTASAKTFRVVRTPLQQDINFTVRVLVLMASVLGSLFAISYAIRAISIEQSVQMAAVIAGLVPAGLILITTTAYAMGALRMSGKGALIQQSNAVESMANVDVLCLDKTGTLTANRIHLDEVIPLQTDEAEFRAILGDYARSTRAGNRTSDALKESCDGQVRELVDEVPFSSARKLSALSIHDGDRQGVYVLGAPEMVAAYLAPGSDVAQDEIDRRTDQGLRVLLMAHSPEAVLLHDPDDNLHLPDTLQPLGLISLSDELRPEARETLAGFMEAGITLKIISGDNPETVASLARQAGLPQNIRVISGAELAERDEAQVAQIAEETTVFGRITPEQKEMLVDMLRANEHYVAMIGDGVNDVLSLKKAHIGIAMQSGSGATRGVADIVLLNDSFQALPAAFKEGQRILNGMEDIIRLFLARAFYAAMIILGTAVVAEAQLFPFIPKHASLITLLTVGAPTLFLAAWARPGVPNHSLTRTVIHFVLPAALMVAAVGLGVYAFYLGNHWWPVVDEAAAAGLQITTAEEIDAIKYAQTAMTTIIIFMGLFLVLFVEPPTRFWAGGDEVSGDWRPTIIAGLMFLTYVGLYIYEPTRVFFELSVLALVDYLFLATVTIFWALLMRYMWRASLFERFLGMTLDPKGKPRRAPA